MPRRNLFRLALLISFLITSAAASAQTVVYDWTSDSKTPESYPQIRRRETVQFRITNVNKILFSYRLEIAEKPLGDDDFKNLAALFDLFRPKSDKQANALTAEEPSCEDVGAILEGQVKDLLGRIDRDPNLPAGYAKLAKHVSVLFTDSQKAWSKYSDEANNTLLPAITSYEGRCGTQVPEQLKTLFESFGKSIENIDNAFKEEQVFVQNHEISPGNDVSATVFEMFGSETIKTKTFTFPGIDVLTLSAGALFSRIPDRTYDARKSPLSDLNVLTVEGNSRATPAIAALLNYSLGGIGLDSDDFGLALSAGPVLKMGAKSDASSFGFFTGLSLHLYHRFYITPGFHFGQFADFPVGFNSGSTVPANFGELNPVKRWTTRFGLAITFKTKDFSGLTGSDKPSVTGTEAGPKPAATPSPSPSPSPSPDTNSSSSNSANMNAVREFLRRPAPPAALKAPAATAGPVSPVTPFLPSEPGASITHVTSIMHRKQGPGIEVVFLGAAVPIRDYAVQFRNGRFFLSLSNTRLDEMEDVVNGDLITDAAFEQHGDVLVVSFALRPGTKAHVEEQQNGLAVTFFLN